MGGLTLGLREGLIGLIVLVALYMVFEVVRIRYLKNKAELAALSPSSTSPVEPIQPKRAERQVERPERRLADSVWEPPLAPPPVDTALRQELAQVREELDSVRGELASLREDMKQELALMRATQTVSPIYGDAMQMAMSGYDPGLIAERCGIARAEAELVVALAKSQRNT